MTAKPHLRLTKHQILALRGIRLPAVALKAMRGAGIYCDPSVSIEYQDLANKYVIRGCEYGGAAGCTGAYCGFVNVDGGLTPWLSRVDSVGRNGVHAVVVASALVRIQMFRNEQTCELLITRHDLKFIADRKRPILENEWSSMDFKEHWRERRCHPFAHLAGRHCLSRTSFTMLSAAPSLESGVSGVVIVMWRAVK